MSKHLIIILLSLIFGLLSFVGSQTMWTKYQGNPVFSGGAAGTWNHHVWRPDVLYNSDSLRFEMWYDASDGPPGWEPYRIGFATSSDGITWNTLNTAVLTPTSGTWDDAAVLWSSVLRENNQYKMWYTGYSYGNPDYKIGYATSPNGITWTKEPAPVITPGPNLWDLGGCGATTVLPTATGYEMWYTGVDAAGSPSQIGYATSDDGISWQKHANNPVLTVGSPGEWDDLNIVSSDVIKIDSIYYLWYNGIQSGVGNNSRIGVAKSLDGITWTKYDDPTTTNLPFTNSDPVLIPSPEQWDGTYVAYGSVMLIGDTLHMWYTGSRSPTPTYLWRIGYATAPVSFHVPTFFSTIQGAIDASNDGNIVLVEDGTYYENINFRGKAITVASRFLVDDDTSHVSNTIIDGSQPTNPDSGSVVTFSFNCDTTSVLMGFTITGGTGKRYIDPWGTILRQGAGVDVLLSGAKIVSNKIINNHIPNNIGYQALGAGISVFGMADENVIIYDNEIHNNTITSNSHTWGAGVSMGTSGMIRFIKNSVCENNNTASGTRLAVGGGLYVWGGNFGGATFNGDILISGNIIKGNTVSPGTGTLVPQGGGGLYIDLCSPQVENNIIAENQAPKGAGILVCAKHRGGLTGNSFPVIFNNTITNNAATQDGGGLYSLGDPANAVHPKVINTILWGNNAPGQPEIQYIGPISVAYSDIAGGFSGINNISKEPMLRGDTLVLSDSSSCIGAGIDSIQIGGTWYHCPTTCFLGHARPTPAGSKPDIGACESPLPSPVVGLEKYLSNNLPISYKLRQNYPNPFNPSTTIEFDLPKSSQVNLKVFNLLGEEVVTLVSDRLSAGSYSYEWDASNLASGVYLYRLEAEGFVQTRKMILMK